MTKALYMDDAYLKEFDAAVTAVKDGKYIELDQTVFYPKSGGVLCDNGRLLASDGTVYIVISVGKMAGEISHEVDKPGLNVGDRVHGIINWERRYALMRHHTSAHILSSILNRETGAMITGNNVETDKLRIDFDLEQFDRDLLQRYVDLANQEIFKNQEISVSYLDREEALKVPGMVKLAGAMPPEVKILRIVKIGSVDLQADGGPHVNNTSEIGILTLEKAENKGKNNRRIYVKLSI